MESLERGKEIFLAEMNMFLRKCMRELTHMKWREETKTDGLMKLTEQTTQALQGLYIYEKEQC